MERISGDIAEIGVWHGKLFILLSLSLAPSEKAKRGRPLRHAWVSELHRRISTQLGTVRDPTGKSIDAPGRVNVRETTGFRVY